MLALTRMLTLTLAKRLQTLTLTLLLMLSLRIALTQTLPLTLATRTLAERLQTKLTWKVGVSVACVIRLSRIELTLTTLIWHQDHLNVVIMALVRPRALFQPPDLAGWP